MDWNVAEDMAETLKVLAHPIRLQIIASLGNRKRSVGRIAATVDRKPAFVSQQLSIMKRRDVLTRIRSGRRVYYRIHDASMARIIECLSTLCGRPLQERP